MHPLERLGELGNQFETWLRDRVGERDSVQGRRVFPLVQQFPERAETIANTIRGGTLTDAEAEALVDGFAQDLEQAKRNVLAALNPSASGNESGGLGMLVVAGLAVGALLYFSRK